MKRPARWILDQKKCFFVNEEALRWIAREYQQYVRRDSSKIK
jgi:hypothetical protein